MGWENVEHWQAPSELGVWELRLNRIDDVFSHAWRVEWGWRGHQRRGASFTGDGREDRARQELQRRKEKHGGPWNQVG